MARSLKSGRGLNAQSKVVILAGGFGTRLSEETYLRPKPMVEIGSQPILWHIMKIYSHYGFNNFVICLGYKGYIIKEYFLNYFLHRSDLTIDLKSQRIEYHRNTCEPWSVTLVDTGLDTLTGGRIKLIRDFVGDQTFMLTYGDGVANVDIEGLLGFHKNNGKYATVTAVKPPSKFGSLDLQRPGQTVKRFSEKLETGNAWINGGFFVLEPEVFDYIQSIETSWEREPLEKLTADRQLVAYRHHGFWRCMDTLRDKEELTTAWNSGKAPWKVWKD
jgi:glucose-1-phosphate cytidylyltransferase